MTAPTDFEEAAPLCAHAPCGCLSAGLERGSYAFCGVECANAFDAATPPPCPCNHEECGGAIAGDLPPDVARR